MIGRSSCVLAASLFILVPALAGCGGPEPGSSEVEPSTSPPARTTAQAAAPSEGDARSADGCEPVRGARIEFWLATPRGEYDDAHRATVLAGERGRYRFESNVPVSYGGRPPHIHVRVTAPGYRDLVTQHYPDAGRTEATFDLVLEPL